MRQRAALIRTLALEPDLLLLDEPFSALDYQTRLSVCDDISSIIRETKKTAILVTHDLSEAISVADRIVILSARPARVKRILDLSFSSPSGPGGSGGAHAASGGGSGGAHTASDGDTASTSTYGRADTAQYSDAGSRHVMSSMERRNAPEFSYYFNLLWKELKTDDAALGPTD